MGANAPILYHSPLNMLHQAAYKQENAWERPYSPHKRFGNWGQSTKALVRRWLKISIVIPLTPLIIYVSQRTGLNTYLAFSITKFPSFADVLSTSYKRLSLLRWIGAVHQRTVPYMLSTGLSTHPLHLNNETPCNLTYCLLPTQKDYHSLNRWIAAVHQRKAFEGLKYLVLIRVSPTREQELELFSCINDKYCRS